MANLLDYLRWRGDLSFSADPFNEVDNLVLAELCFIDFSHIVSDAPAEGETDDLPTLKEAAGLFFAEHPKESVNMGLFVPAAIVELLDLAASSRRFGSVSLYGYRDIYDETREMQFAALTFRLPDGSDYVAFRGTDDTLLGWKEDLNMGILPVIPAQTEASSYLLDIARHTRRPLRVGGHSKGGNLAVYSATSLPEDLWERVLFVYNNDGPGFRTDRRALPAYQALASRMEHFTPTRSVVGALLSHDDRMTILESDGHGVFQHDGFNWHIMGNAFVRSGDRTRRSLELESALKGMIANMTPEEAADFINAFFYVLGCTGAKTLSDISDEKLRSAYRMGATLFTLKKPLRDALLSALLLFFREKNKVTRKRRAEEKAEKAKKTERAEKADKKTCSGEADASQTETAPALADTTAGVGGSCSTGMNTEKRATGHTFTLGERWKQFTGRFPSRTLRPDTGGAQPKETADIAGTKGTAHTAGASQTPADKKS